jgi:DNA polymerase-3 subunit alpha
LSLFGAHTGVTESVSLPLVPDADRRETLAWERELIGMYMGEHPLAAYMKQISQVVSYFSSNLGEAAHEEKVRVAGMVTAIRPHQTKTGKMMAWVTLEDLAGIIELVVFPRTWEKYQFALEIGGVILAEGKVDAQSSPSKVLVDNFRTEIKLTEPAQNAAGATPPAQMVLQPQKSAQARKPGIPAPQRVAEIPPATRQPAAPIQPIPDVTDMDDEPPEEPPDWENYASGGVSFAEKALAVSSQQSEVDDQPAAVDPIPDVGRAPILAPQSTIKNQQSAISQVSPVILVTPKVPAASRPVRLDDEHPPQILTVILRPSGDSQRDIRRISRLHGTFISYPGKDRFAFQIFEEGRGHLIEFPNDNTHLCPELLITIKDAVGEENLRIEPILYQ